MKLWLIPLIAVAAVTCHAQQIGFISSNTNSGVQTCVFLGGVTSGDILIVGADTFGTLTGISDTVSSTWTLVDSDTAQSLITRVWVATAASTGSDTATVTGTNSSNGINCVRLSATYWTATVDFNLHSAAGYSGTPATVTTTSGTSSVDGDFLYCYISGFQNTGVLQPASPSLLAGAQNQADSRGIGYQVTGTNGSQSCTFNNVNNTKGNYVVIALKPVSGLTITTTSLPTASTSNAYSYQMQAIGGVGAYTWSISSGTLQTGLSINSSTGVISGTATAGTQTFTVQAVGATSGTGTKSLTLTVNGTASTPTFVQSSTGSSGVTGSVTGTSGNVNVVSVYHYTNGNFSFSPPTDTAGTTYQFCGAVIGPGGGSSNLVLAVAYYIGKIAATGANVVTTSSNSSVVAAEFSGAQAFCDTSVLTSAKSAASATLTSSSIATVTPNSMLYAGVDGMTNTTTFTNVTLTADGNIGNGSTSPLYTEYAVEASVSSYTPQFTQVSNTDGNWAMFATALRPGTSGPVATSGLKRHNPGVF